MTNPLEHMGRLPPFSQIRPGHVMPALERCIAANRALVASLLEEGRFDFDSLLLPLMQANERLNRLFSPVRHLNAVASTDELRAEHDKGVPLLSEYWTDLGQNKALFDALKAMLRDDASPTTDAAAQRVVALELRDFELAGVALPEADKARFKTVSQRLSELSSRFQNNVLDATSAWSHVVTDADALAGIPGSVLAMFAENASGKGQDGWLIGLDFPSVQAVLNFAENRELRFTLYQAFATRASDQGPNAGEYDNSEVIAQTLALRHEKAQLLGFDNYSEYSVATKMAQSAAEVAEFLEDLARRAKQTAQAEYDELVRFARAELGIDELAAWDVNYASEKLRQSRYALSQEDIKPYFAAPAVIAGLFEVANRLYGVRVEGRDGVDVWHEDVSFHDVRDADGELLASFYLDPYARGNKRSGAWMDTCVSRMRSGEGVDFPVAYLSCNFTPPVDGEPALLTHDEVITLFHEFGHGLHHMLTRIDYPAISGINGVEWDAVELPSQFMENWCWEREALDLFARHHSTGERLPDALFAKMREARNFQSAMALVRQLEFALFDLRLHREYDPDDPADVMDVLNRVRAEVAVVRPPAFNRFPHAFSHIFAGGYAAGYYSYKWAEVLSADAFSLFEERGVFDADAGQRFRREILETGGSRPALDSFIAFRGRKPAIDALLRHSGIG